MVRRPVLSLATLALAGCAHVARGPARYGAFSSELEARSIARTFNCDVGEFAAQYDAHRQQPVAVGDRLCTVLGRFGDPEFVDKNDVVSTGVARIRYRVNRQYYRVSTTRRDGTWVVTAAGMAAR